MEKRIKKLRLVVESVEGVQKFYDCYGEYPTSSDIDQLYDMNETFVRDAYENVFLHMLNNPVRKSGCDFLANSIIYKVRGLHSPLKKLLLIPEYAETIAENVSKVTLEICIQMIVEYGEDVYGPEIYKKLLNSIVSNQDMYEVWRNLMIMLDDYREEYVKNNAYVYGSDSLVEYFSDYMINHLGIDGLMEANDLFWNFRLFWNFVDEQLTDNDGMQYHEKLACFDSIMEDIIKLSLADDCYKLRNDW